MNQQKQSSVVMPENWRKHWEAWKVSGLSQAEYGRRHQLNIHVFRYWITKFNQPQPLPMQSLVKLPTRIQNSSESTIELVVEQKYRLIIHKHFDASLLQAVLASLEGRVCS